jgi:hypothetical protein
LDSYDLILGIDWLEQFSPMEIHWKEKWLSIPYHGDTICLQGIVVPSDSDMVFQLMPVPGPNGELDTPPWPLEIVALLNEFAQVFQPPTSLPPKRSCDHTIPLVEGATPVNI